MRRERMTRIGVCVLLLGTVALTGCRLAEHGRRAAIDAFASFVLGSISQAPLTQAKPQFSGAQPAPQSQVAAAAAPAHDVQKCPSSTAAIELPTPQPRIASINLAPAVIEIRRIAICPDVARAKVEARMALAEVRGMRQDRVRRIVVVLPEIAPEAPPVPATL